MNLLRAELLRIGHRRITRVAMVLAILFGAVAGVTTFVQHSDGPPDLATANVTAAANEADCRAYYRTIDVTDEAQLAQDCFMDPVWFVEDQAFHLQGILAGDGRQDWRTVRDASLTRFGYTVDTAGIEERLSPTSGFGGELISLGHAALFICALLGAVWIGGDWRNGVMESQLVWHPHRLQLVGAKLGAVSLAGALGGLLAATLGIAIALPAAWFRGDTSGTGLSFWVDVAATSGRIVGAAAIGAVIGAAIALVTRHTAAGVAAVLTWSVVVAFAADAIGGPLLELAPFTNLRAWVAQADATFLETIRHSDGGTEQYTAIGHGWLTAGALGAAVAAVMIAAGAGVFARRDVS